MAAVVQHVNVYIVGLSLSFLYYSHRGCISRGPACRMESLGFIMGQNFGIFECDFLFKVSCVLCTGHVEHNSVFHPGLSISAYLPIQSNLFKQYAGMCKVANVY